MLGEGEGHSIDVFLNFTVTGKCKNAVQFECVIVWKVSFGQVGKKKKVIMHLIKTIGKICDVLWPKRHLYLPNISR